MARTGFIGGVILSLVMIFLNDAFSQKVKLDSLQTLMESEAGKTLSSDRRMKNYLTLSEYSVRGNTDDALKYGMKALAEARSIPHRLGEAMSLNMIGNAWTSKSIFDSAERYYNSSLDVMQALHDTTGIIQVINNLGVLFKTEGNYRLAIGYYKQSYQLAARRHDTTGMVLTNNNLGIVYYDWKQYDMALEHYNSALDMLRRQGDSVRIAVLLNNAGELFKETGKPDEALANYFESLQISLKRKMRMTSMNSYLDIGNVYFTRSEFSSAEEYYRKALSLAAEMHYPFGIAMSGIRLGEALMMLDRSDEAFSYLSEGASLSVKLNDLVLKRDAGENLFRYYERKGLPGQALSSFKDYIAARDSLFNLNSRKELAVLRTEYETDKKEQEIKLLTQEKAIQSLEINRHKNLLIYTVSIAVFMLLAAYFAYARFRFKQLHIKSELEKLNLEIEQRLLRSQMSPHFIFNSLNSINSFIAGNDTTSAGLFLTKFADLIRLILENSRKTFISFSDELMTLGLYLELERMRFVNKFDFEIIIDAGSVDPDNTYIPPMLVQPFVENALLHGVAHLQSEGKVTVAFAAGEGAMTVTVTDNGVGRRRAAEIEEKPDGRQSLGMQLTNERLQLLGTQFPGTFSASVTDLTGADGKPSGTKVVIQMPLETE